MHHPSRLLSDLSSDFRLRCVRGNVDNKLNLLVVFFPRRSLAKQSTLLPRDCAMWSRCGPCSKLRRPYLEIARFTKPDMPTVFVADKRCALHTV